MNNDTDFLAEIDQVARYLYPNNCYESTRKLTNNPFLQVYTQWRMQQERLKHELRMQRERHEHELAIAEKKSEIELAKLYQPGGDYHREIMAKVEDN